MADIRLIRIDFRLIHGQVVTKWFGQSRANEILIIDDELAQDDFMSSIYEMSAPPGSKLTINTVDEAVRRWNSDGLGSGRVLVLFKGVDQAHQAWREGFPCQEIQIGGLGSAPGRKAVFGPITLNDADAKKLKEMQDAGVHVYLHQVPEEGSMEFAAVLEKNDFDVS